jgi:hypothetical protein
MRPLTVLPNKDRLFMRRFCFEFGGGLGSHGVWEGPIAGCARSNRWCGADGAALLDPNNKKPTSR